jgi:hypothetical protein
VADSDHSDDFGFGTSWSGDAPSPGVAQISTPRVLWLVLGAAVSLIGVLVAALFGAMIIPAVAGWLLSGPIAIGLLAAFVQSETRRRAMPTFASYAWVQPLYVLCIVLALGGVVVSALRIALWAGRL